MCFLFGYHAACLGCLARSASSRHLDGQSLGSARLACKLCLDIHHVKTQEQDRDSRGSRAMFAVAGVVFLQVLTEMGKLPVCMLDVTITYSMQDYEHSLRSLPADFVYAHSRQACYTEPVHEKSMCLSLNAASSLSRSLFLPCFLFLDACAVPGLLSWSNRSATKASIMPQQRSATAVLSEAEATSTTTSPNTLDTV
jgi:hypothetical protein